MHGVRSIFTKDGVPIQSVVGHGLMTGGIGIPMNPGGGQRTTMVAGTLMIFMVGCGFRDMNGRPLGWNGGTAGTISGGHHSRRTQCSAYTSESIIKHIGPPRITIGHLLIAVT